MKGDSNTRILCVDDDQNILSALKRNLISEFDVTTAQSGTEGMQIFKEAGPFPIVVSDLRMSEIDGVTFLGNIRQVNPDTIRILLTGQADLDSAISAVNEGNIFRFLTKPCESDILIKSLKNAESQYNLIMAEKVLLEQTLQGSITTLIEILSLANPALFAMVNRTRSLLDKLLQQLSVPEKWPIEVAAMLCQIGTVTLPDEIIQKIVKMTPLNNEEAQMVSRIPMVGEKLLSNIPRLEPVREILLYQEKHFDGSGLPPDNCKGESIPLGARILKILIDYDGLLSKKYDTAYIFNTLYGRSGWYDEKLLKQFASLCGASNKSAEIREISINSLVNGMYIAEDIVTKNGILLVSRGIKVSPALIERIKNIASRGGIKEPIRVTINP